MKEYQTQQRRALLDFFRDNSEREFTIDEVLGGLPEMQISRSSVYRNIDRMVEEGLLSKSLPAGNRKTKYRYVDCGDCCERVHLKCEKCGKLLHMESRTDEERLNEILMENGFKLDEHATVLLGVCEDCD